MHWSVTSYHIITTASMKSTTKPPTN